MNWHRDREPQADVQSRTPTYLHSSSPLKPQNIDLISVWIENYIHLNLLRSFFFLVYYCLNYNYNYYTITNYLLLIITIMLDYEFINIYIFSFIYMENKLWIVMKIRITNYESKLWDSLKNIADITVSRFFISFISIASTMPSPLFFSPKQMFNCKA